MRLIRDILARLYLPLWYLVISFIILGVIAGIFGGLFYELIFGYSKSVSISPYVKEFIQAQWDWLGGALLVFLCLFAAAWREYKRREGKKAFRLFRPCRELKEPRDIEFHPHEDRPWQHDYISRSLAKWPISDEVSDDASKFGSEKDLASLLRREKWVLLIGQPTDGKTRTVFEVLRDQLQDFYALIPEQRNLDLTYNAKLLLRGKKIILVLDDLDNYADQGSELLRYIDEVTSEADTCSVIATCKNGSELMELQNIREGVPLSAGGGNRLFSEFKTRLTLAELTYEEKHKLNIETNQNLSEKQLEASPRPGDIVLAERKRKMKQRFKNLSPKDQDLLRVLQLLEVADLSPTHRRVLQVVKEVFDRPVSFSEMASIRDTLSLLTAQGFVNRPADANPIQPELAYVGDRYGVVSYLDDRTPQSDLVRLSSPLKSLDDGDGLVALGRTLGTEYQKWDDAIDCFNLAISLSEENANAWGYKGYALSRQDRYEPALECYNRALEIDNDLPEVWNSKGYALSKLGRHEDAIECHDLAIELGEDYAAAWNRKGYVLTALDRLEEALQCFERESELRQEDLNWGHRGYSLVQSGWPEMALKCYDHALAKVEQDNTLWRNKGYTFSRLEEYEEALACYNRALEIDDSDAAAWKNKGFALVGMGQRDDDPDRFKEALHCFDQALEIDDTVAETWKNKGYTFSRLEEYEEALACYNRALEIDDSVAGTWKNKGYTFSRLEEYEEALASFNRALDIDETNAPAWRGKGYIHVELGQYEEALDCYNRSLELDGEDAETWKNKGHALNELDRNREALRCFDHAVEVGETNVEAWRGRGYTLVELDEHEEAIDCYDQALDIDESDPVAWKNKGFALVELGKREDDPDHFEEALACFNEALDHTDQDSVLWRSKGYALSRLDEFEEAIDCYDQALDIDESDATTLALKGYALNATEKYEEAIDCLDRALAIDDSYATVWKHKKYSFQQLGREGEAAKCSERLEELT